MTRPMKCVIAILIVDLVFVGWALLLARQEKPLRPTRQWQLGWTPGVEGGKGARVDVIDTEGVCLYVAHAYTALYPVGSGASVSLGVSIAAVSKAALPAGTGCQ